MPLQSDKYRRRGNWRAIISVEFSESDQIFQQTISDFARSEIEPISFDAEWDGKFSLKILSKATELGLFGIMVPHDLGGAGADLSHTCHRDRGTRHHRPPWPR